MGGRSSTARGQRMKPPTTSATSHGWFLRPLSSRRGAGHVSSVSQRRVGPKSPPSLHPPATSSRTEDVIRPRRSLRHKPAVEITTRLKRARHSSKRTRTSRLSKETLADPDFVPSEGDADSDSDGEDEHDDEKPPKKRRRTVSGARSQSQHASPSTSASSKAQPTVVAGYSRKTDYARFAFTSLHGDIRCIFCPLVSRSDGVKPRGTFHRLPDAASRHLRDVCPHVEKSHAYQQARANGLRLKKDVVSYLVRRYEKIAIAQVHCRQDEDYKRRCVALGLSPAKVESRLARHAVLYKMEDCDCCPLPRYSEYLAVNGITGDTQAAEKRTQVKGPKVAKSGRARRKKREVIEISDDEATIEEEEVVDADSEMEDVMEEREVAADRVGVKGEVVGRQPKEKAKHLQAAKNEGTRRKEREVIEISDDDEAPVVNGEVVQVNQDANMEGAAEERDVVDERGEGVEVKEEVKQEEAEEVQEEEEEVTIREVHIKVKKGGPRVKKEEGAAVRLEDCVKKEEQTRTVPTTRSHRVRTKREDS
ncbi:hypothetical protein OH76DRAFT_835016 [Lentinus brumalis]|uniref:Uncharacterized protein n=1 Tax=Lentinus brumalis TaxID=2498619 RepID=A0A371D204_9APHY|nr:hypothetical protein OH76DRAFT_835016 [Polyporus brumalis]